MTKRGGPPPYPLVLDHIDRPNKSLAKGLLPDDEGGTLTIPTKFSRFRLTPKIFQKKFETTTKYSIWWRYNMFLLLFLGLGTSCVTNKALISKARHEIVGNCLEEIEIKLMEHHCNNIEFFRGDEQFVFRCDKPDVQRKTFWDTWWFRLTSPTKSWPAEIIAEVSYHTICIDGRYRIEAYPPEEGK